MASANTQPPPTLLLIDLQAGLLKGDPSWGPRSTPQLETNVPRLLALWRGKTWPIIHIQHDDPNAEKNGNPISILHPETFRIADCAAPEEGEEVIVKHHGSAWKGTWLEAVMLMIARGEKDPEGLVVRQGIREGNEWELKKGRIVVAGMDGGQCVNSSVREGADFGFQMCVVGDACASYGCSPWGVDVKLDVDVIHGVAMGLLQDYARLVKCEELLKELGSQGW